MINQRLVYVGSILLAISLVLMSRGLNFLTFTHNELVPGGDWVSLPAGVRLLVVLVLGEPGLIGATLGSTILALLLPTHAHWARFLSCSVIAGLAPFLACRYFGRFLGVDQALANLTPGRLIALIAINAAIGPLLRVGVCIANGDFMLLPTKLGAMFIGDLAGGLAVVYLIKLMLSMVTLPKSSSSRIQ